MFRRGWLEVKNAPGRTQNRHRHRRWGGANNLWPYSSKRLKSACVGTVRQRRLLPNTHGQRALAVEPALGKWGQEFTQNKGEPGYPSVVAVNTGGGVLTKVGSVRAEIDVVNQFDCLNYQVISIFPLSWVTQKN